MSDKEIELSSPRLRVVMGDVELPDTWEEIIVQTVGRDRSRAEQMIAWSKWGKIDEGNIFRLQELMGWYALTRSRRIPEMEFDTFLDAYLEIEVLDEDSVRPTPPGPAPG